MDRYESSCLSLSRKANKYFSHNVKLFLLGLGNCEDANSVRVCISYFICTRWYQQVLETVIYGNKMQKYFKHLYVFWQKLLFKQTHWSILTVSIQCSLCLPRGMNTLWGLSVPSFFMMPDGRPYTQCSALSIMSCTLIPKLVVGTVCVAQMKVTGHRSDCCFNWSPEPRPSLSALHSKPRFSFQLLFLLPSSRGVLILLPSAVSIGTNVYQQASWEPLFGLLVS